MKASDLILRYNAQKHIENGCFIERNETIDSSVRQASGMIYYYVSPGEITKFHEIDCDEYWSYNAGSTLEIWSIRDGKINKLLLGNKEGAEPTILLKKGDIFGSRLSSEAIDGTFVTCITVPRFTYDGFKLYDDETIVEMYPETKEFFKK